MRMPMLLAAWFLSFLSLAHAQVPADDLTGTYAMQTERGPIVVRIAVTGGQVAGTLDAPGSKPIALMGNALGRYARGTMSSGSETGEFEALVEGETLNLRLSQGAETVPLRLQRVEQTTAAAPPPTGPAPGPEPAVPGGAGDTRLVGTWVSQTLITSGDASMASEEFLIFRADGWYAYGKGRAVAGGSNWGVQGGGGPTERGRWRAQDGIFYILQQDGQWQRVGRYGMTEDGQTMRITYEGGGRKLWSRRQ
jgi:hypothetical protein